jgi:hypothetical protein
MLFVGIYSVSSDRTISSRGTRVEDTTGELQYCRERAVIVAEAAAVVVAIAILASAPPPTATILYLLPLRDKSKQVDSSEQPPWFSRKKIVSPARVKNVEYK